MCCGVPSSVFTEVRLAGRLCLNRVAVRPEEAECGGPGCTPCTLLSDSDSGICAANGSFCSPEFLWDAAVRLPELGMRGLGFCFFFLRTWS